MRAMLTGGTGFIGRCLLDRLLLAGDTVRVLVRPETIGKRDRIRHLRRDGVEVVAGSLADRRALAQAVRGTSVVYHLAALTRPSSAGQQHEVTVQGTENLLRASLAADVGRFVLASSVAVYGPPAVTARPVVEDAPLRAWTPYAAVKIQAEKLVQEHCGAGGLAGTILRPALVYGSGARCWRAAVTAVLARPLTVGLRPGGDAAQLVHVRDVADAIVLAGRRRRATGEAFNIAGDRMVTPRELAGSVWRVATAGQPPGWLLPLGMDHRPWLRYDIAKAEALLGFAPRISLEDGIGELLAGQAMPW